MTKNFVPLLNERMAQIFANLVPGIEMLEVQGMDINGSQNAYKVLIAPVQPPVEPYVPIETPLPPQPQAPETTTETLSA